MTIKQQILGNGLSLGLIYLSRLILPLTLIPILNNYHSDILGEFLYFLSWGLWVMTLIEFGFNVSLTRRLSRDGIAKKKINNAIASTYVAKFILFTIALCIYFIMSIFLQIIDVQFVFKGIIYGFLMGLMPIFYFHSQHKIHQLMLIEVISSVIILPLSIILLETVGKLSALLNLFILIKLAANVLAYILMSKFTGFTWNKNRIKPLSYLKNAILPFKTRVYSSIYTGFFPVYVGFFLEPKMMSSFLVAEKVIKGLTALINQAALSVFPVFTRLGSKKNNQAYHNLKRYLIYIFLVMCIFVVIIQVSSASLVQLYLYKEPNDTTSFINMMSLIIPPISISSFLVMGFYYPRSKFKFVNDLTLYAGVGSLILGYSLYLYFGLTGFVTTIIIVEWAVFIFLALNFIKYNGN